MAKYYSIAEYKGHSKRYTQNFDHEPTKYITPPTVYAISLTFMAAPTSSPVNTVSVHGSFYVVRLHRLTNVLSHCRGIHMRMTLTTTKIASNGTKPPMLIH